MRKGLLGVEELTPPEIQAVLDRARFFKPLQRTPQKLDRLRGKTIYQRV